MKIFWFFPTHGDGHYLGTSIGGRPVTYSYLRQIAQAAEELGYTGALLPTGRSCEDAWVTASSLISATNRLTFLVALRPGIISPTASARMAATFDRLSQGRLLLNVVTGGDPVELAGDGVHLSHDERYALTDEFLTIWRSLLAEQYADFQGEHLHVSNGKLLLPSMQKPYPPLYFGGSSDAAIKVASEHADVYLTWGEPPREVEEKVKKVRKAAAEQGRKIEFGIRLHIIVRNTTEEAWQAADRLIQHVDLQTIETAQKALAHFDSTGQQRMMQLHAGRFDSLEVSPNLWAGIGLVRSGAGTALVGDPDVVAKRIREYADIGIDTFILSGYPHLEEAYRVAELLFPRLPLAEQVAPPVAASGEVLANEQFPLQLTGKVGG